MHNIWGTVAKLEPNGFHASWMFNIYIDEAIPWTETESKGGFEMGMLARGMAPGSGRISWPGWKVKTPRPHSYRGRRDWLNWPWLGTSSTLTARMSGCRQQWAGNWRLGKQTINCLLTFGMCRSSAGKIYSRGCLPSRRLLIPEMRRKCSVTGV